MQKVKVFLVGAGPGDEGLITVRGLELVRAADVLVYDQLGTAIFLKEAKAGCELHNVGKFAGNHLVAQDEINKLLVEKALEFGDEGIVVRLKGGDPFVFGRGGEEALYLYEHKIRFEIVPGVTSAISAAAYAGIPITQRGYTTSLAITTGHEAAKEISDIDWQALSGIGTLVFLMGVANLGNICAELIKAGKVADTPVAIVENASIPEQRTVCGTLATIVKEAERAKIVAPAVLIIGEVVRLREQLSWFEQRPLFGKTIIVTRAKTQIATLAKRLRGLGAKVLECPTIKINKKINTHELESFLQEHKDYSHLIFTSANGVDSFFEQLLKNKMDARFFADKTLVCIGSGTAAALASVGIVADYIPETYVAEAVAPYFKDIKASKIAIIRAEKARDFLIKALTEQGHEVKIVPIYQTQTETPEIQNEVIDKLLKDEIDFVTFTSSSTADGFKKLIESRLTDFNKVPAAVIGPITKESCIQQGYQIKCQASKYDIDGLIEAILSTNKDLDK